MSGTFRLEIDLLFQELQAWTSCSVSAPSGGDLVEWNSAVWALENMIVEEKPREEICKPVR